MRAAIVLFSVCCVGLLPADGLLSAQSLTVAQVETARKRAAEHMSFDTLQFVGSSLRHAGFNLGLGTTEADPHHLIDGINRAGQKVSIPFSDIVLIRKIASNGTKVQLEIVRFPDISPEALISLNPNCKQLSTYRRLVRIFVESPNSRPEYWLGSTDEYGDIDKLGRVADMQQGVTMRLKLPVEERWWAVPSILHDPLCSTVLDPLGSDTHLRPPER